MQFAGSLPQQREAGAHDLPFFFAVAGRGQGAHDGECGVEAGDGGESCDQIEETAFFPLLIGGETQALINLLSECSIAGEQQRGKTHVGLASLFHIGERSGGKLDQLGEFLMKLAAALLAGKARQLQRFFARSGNVIEKPTQLNQSVAHGIRKGPLQPLAERVPIRLAFENKAVHPAVAALEHFDQQRFHLLPAVVAAIEELLLWRDNGWQEMEELLVEMLKSRDRWMHGFVLEREPDWDALRERLERPFANAVRDALH